MAAYQGPLFDSLCLIAALISAMELGVPAQHPRDREGSTEP